MFSCDAAAYRWMSVVIGLIKQVVGSRVSLTAILEVRYCEKVPQKSYVRDDGDDCRASRQPVCYGKNEVFVNQQHGEGQIVRLRYLRRM